MATAVAMAAVGLSGCGGHGSEGRATTATDGIKASVGTYVTALAKHDAAGACNVVTAAYWSATATELVAQLRNKAYADLPSDSCQQGLKHLFSGSHGSASVAKFAVSNVRVKGRVATAHLTLGKSTSDGSVANARFIKAPSGIWQIDCCTGSQLSKGPPPALG
ncbi:MAG: hypothetical protein ACXVE4_11380 [Solirubrobacteraceae bacterium]